jgi:DNA-directed RNA polymerase specialized sigma24 family protein
MTRLMRLRPVLIGDPKELLTVSALNHFRKDWTTLASRGHRRALAHSLNDPAQSPTVAQIPDPRPDPATAMADDDELGVRGSELHAAIKRLSPMEQVLLEAYYFAGRSPQQIDEARGDAPGTARCRIHRARARLRLILPALDGDSERSR